MSEPGSEERAVEDAAMLTKVPIEAREELRLALIALENLELMAGATRKDGEKALRLVEKALVKMLDTAK